MYISWYRQRYRICYETLAGPRFAFRYEVLKKSRYDLPRSHWEAEASQREGHYREMIAIVNHNMNLS